MRHFPNLDALHNILEVWTPKLDAATQPFLVLSDMKQGGGG